jgi:hypothetical protein
VAVVGPHVLDGPKEPFIDSGEGVISRRLGYSLGDSGPCEYKLTHPIKLRQGIPFIYLEWSKFAEYFQHMVSDLCVL